MVRHRTGTIISLVLAVTLLCMGTPVAFADEASGTASVDDARIAEALQGVDDGATVLTSSTGDAEAVTLYGDTLYDTAAQEALYAYDESSYAIIASGESYVDALSATSLAGALNCPILLTSKAELPEVTKDALESLGVEHIVIVGGTSVVSAAIAQELAAYGPIDRLYGDSQYDTQLDVYRYGRDNGLWAQDGMVIVASGSQEHDGMFADALSISPVAFAECAPVFLVDDSGALPEATAAELLSSDFTHAVIAGGSSVVSDRTEGFMEFVTMSNGAGRNVERLAGETLYDTSAAVAEWAVETGVLTWDGVAFSTGKQPYDALAGSVVQGSEKSVLLLIDDGYTAALDAVARSGAVITSLKFFGGTAVVSNATRALIGNELNLYFYSTHYREYNLTLNTFVDIEYANNSAHSYDAYLAAINPDGFEAGDASFYQFAILSDGYSGVSAEQLDSFIEKMVVYQEENYGVTSALRGTGAFFVEAAKMYGVNEVYLLSHAALESAWGCSALAQGTVEGYEGYMNFYGIGAYDSDPNNAGASKAKNEGWTSPEKAVLGAAEWIASNYICPAAASAGASGDQNTLYKMKWDLARAETSGQVWHQYATSLTWASGIASVMSNCYGFCGLAMGQTGLEFEVPRFSA